MKQPTAATDVTTCSLISAYNRDEFKAWIGSAGDWTTVVLPMSTAVMSHMKSEKGAETFGMAGFCWGGKMCMQAATMGPDSGILATACVHPAFLTPELASEVRVLLLIAAGFGF